MALDEYGDPLECLDHSEWCKGEVEYHVVGDSRPFPRCEFHLERRWECEFETRRKYPVNAPSDFSWFDAGESWDED